MPEGATTSVDYPLSNQLPLPAIAVRKGRIGVERSAAPSLVALTTSLVAISSNQPRALLLFIGAGTVILGLFFVVPHRDEEKTHPIMSAFLLRLPDVLTTVSCALIVLGIGVAFPNQVALIPLFLFISFAALAAFFGLTLAVWVTAALYATALISLVMFVVLAFTA